MGDSSGGAFGILSTNNEAEREAWSALWGRWAEAEPYAHPAFVRLFATDGAEALCAVMEFAGGFALYPFIRRPVPGTDRFDITSAYGYGGPFLSGHATRSDVDAFWESFEDWAATAGIVSEFVRFALFPGELLPYPADKEYRLDNVVRSLGMDDATMWREFDAKVRKNVQKAQRSGVSIEFDAAGTRLEDFLRIYYGTMERRSAAQAFLFPRTFFETLLREMPRCVMFVHALREGAVISTELLLLSSRSCYSFLGGTDETAFAVRPNDVLKFETIRWGRERGLDNYVLGGGAAPDDGIFRYKRAFAPNGVVPFFVGKRILDAAAYDRLTDERHARSSDGAPAATTFFPAYRAP